MKKLALCTMTVSLLLVGNSMLMNAAPSARTSPTTEMVPTTSRSDPASKKLAKSVLLLGQTVERLQSRVSQLEGKIGALEADLARMEQQQQSDRTAISTLHTRLTRFDGKGTSVQFEEPSYEEEQ